MSRTVIGLVGGIASGKSSVAAVFSAERPGVHVDADVWARKVAERPAVRAEIARRFPAALREGTLDRARLARIVFGDPRALADLEAITHPRIRRSVRRAIGAADGMVYLDAALLQETGADQLCDWVVYVACPARTRRARARRTRGWTDAEHGRRGARQWSCRKKRAHSDLVVDNGGDRARTRRDVRRALRCIDRKGS